MSRRIERSDICRTVPIAGQIADMGNINKMECLRALVKQNKPIY
jgi:hypothetical protein